MLVCQGSSSDETRVITPGLRLGQWFMAPLHCPDNKASSRPNGQALIERRTLHLGLAAAVSEKRSTVTVNCFRNSTLEFFPWIYAHSIFHV